MSVPTLREVLAEVARIERSRVSSNWLRHQLSSALEREPLTATMDAECLAQLLVQRCVLTESLGCSGLASKAIYETIERQAGSSWLRQGLMSALERDTIDSAHDANQLALVVARWRNAIALEKRRAQPASS